MALLAAGKVCLADSASRLLLTNAATNCWFANSRCLESQGKQSRALSSKAGNSVEADKSTPLQHDASNRTPSSGTISAGLVYEATVHNNSSGTHGVSSLTTAVVPVSAGRPTHSYVSADVLANISSTVNQLTGYESIDRLKANVVESDRHLQQCKQHLQAAKVEYEQQLARQTQLHREVTALLQRKSSWVPADVARFTELYAAEHQAEQAVAAAKARYSNLGDEAERLQLQLVDLIRERYQQEQLWSDKIRRASTWWTWGLMGLHFASFVLVYTVFEPRKRLALQQAIANMLEQHTAAVDARIATLSPAAAAAAAAGGGGGGAGCNDEQQKKQQGQQQQRQETSADQQGQHVSRQAVPNTVVSEQGQLFQQHVVQELRLLRQQLHELQEAAPTAAAGAVQAALSDKQQHRSFAVPGSRWLAQQWTAAAQSAKALWQSSRHKARHLFVRPDDQQATLEDQLQDQVAEVDAGSSSSSSAPEDAVAGDSIARISAATNENRQQTAQQQPQQLRTHVEHNTSAATQQIQPAPAGPVQVVSAPDTAAHQVGHQPPSGPPPSLMKQWASGDSVLKVTRSQLVLITSGAGALGAGLAAVLLLLLRSSGGPSSS